MNLGEKINQEEFAFHKEFARANELSMKLGLSVGKGGIYLMYFSINELIQQTAHVYYHLRGKKHERVKGDFSKSKLQYYQKKR